jgi:transcriptional regulator with PAS, ATPase and Fis domain
VYCGGEPVEESCARFIRGSFTGTDPDHPGMIGAARDGTLFLDEIGEFGLDLQPKLLRFLVWSSEVCPIGAC